MWLALAPMAFMWIASYLLQPVFLPRALLPSAVMFYVALAWLFARSRLPFAIRAVLGAGWGAVIVFGLVTHYTWDRFPNPPFDRAVTYLRAHLTEGDVVVHGNKITALPMLYYGRDVAQHYVRDIPGSGSDTLALPTQQVLGALADGCVAEAAQGAPRVWYVAFDRLEEEMGELIAEKPDYVRYDALAWLRQHYTLQGTTAFHDLLVYQFVEPDEEARQAVMRVKGGCAVVATRTTPWASSRSEWALWARWCCLVLAANVVVTHQVLTAPYPGHNDFMSRWEGARSYWRDGLDPYGDRASANIQQRIYGRMATPEEDPGYFAYPFYTVFLVVAPGLCFLCVGICHLDGGSRSLPDRGAAIPVRSVLLAPSAMALGSAAVLDHRQLLCSARSVSGAAGHLVYLCQVLALWGLARGRDRLAGVALALSTIKPQMGFLLVPFLLLLGLRLKRWHFMSTFLATLGALMGASLLCYPPGWENGWRRYACTRRILP
ncbi:MAG: hypothetical protein KatS3mg051_1478 [Anaerolineae bacterium]|nr:MAG: hypothetical protein KatS3mg051_1478 [Anaerolineae bacterium]